jgi:hypothetical protein
VNAGFPSHTIDAGVPCNLKIFSKNGRVILEAVYRCLMAMKCLYLESLSTTTKIVVFP